MIESVYNGCFSLVFQMIFVMTHFNLGRVPDYLKFIEISAEVGLN